MTKVVNNTDKLTYILTDYGLNRVAEALTDSTVKIILSKIKVGDANYEYYEPEQSATRLLNPIPNGEFPIVDKELLEDGLTVSLHAIFPENLDNCEIREVGVYETVNGRDYLFAISTQQPLIKPAEDLYYFTTVDYYVSLKSQNLSDIYDQILLDSDSQLVTQEKLDNLIATIAFTESNLMEQINGNSRVIGLNRAQQLFEKIEENRENFGYITSYNNYTILADFVKEEEIFAYWLFNYSKIPTPTASITDISKNGRNLSVNVPVNNYSRTFAGLMPTLSFNSPNYYYLEQTDSTLTFDSNKFSIIGSPSVSVDGIARNFTDDNYVAASELVTKVNKTYSLYLTFQTQNLNEDQRIIYTTKPYSFVAYTSESSSELIVKFGDGTTWINTLSVPINENTEYSIRVLFNDSTSSISFLTNGTYKVKTAGTHIDSYIRDFGTLTFGKGNPTFSAFAGSIDLKKVSLTEDNVQIFAGGSYEAVNDMSFVDKDDEVDDIPFTMAFALEPLSFDEDRTLLARSNYATNYNIFEVTEKADKSLEVKLFSDSANYITFTSSTGAIPNKAHSIIIKYEPSTKLLSAYISGHKTSMVKVTTGTYNHMNTAPSMLYSFTYTPHGEIWANNPSTPTTLYNQDGTPYEGDEWKILNNAVFYNDYQAAYNISENVQTEKLFAWNYNDGLYNHPIYTKTLTLEADTPLYNADYTLYTEHEFKIILSGDEYIIQYNTNTADYDEVLDIESKTLYAFYYMAEFQTIWANSSSIPTVLYNSNADVYSGVDWKIEDNTVIYKNEGIASYNSAYNTSVPTLPVTSYVIGANGTPEKYVNSNVGMVAVIKASISDEHLRILATNLEATVGNNPCISTY